jgi:hypothetical protein
MLQLALDLLVHRPVSVEGHPLAVAPLEGEALCAMARRRPIRRDVSQMLLGRPAGITVQLPQWPAACQSMHRRIVRGSGDD